MRLLGNNTVPLAVSVEDFGRAIPWIEVDDPLTIKGKLTAAQEVVEVASRRPLTLRSVEIEFDLEDADGFWSWWFPIAPVASVAAVEAVSPTGQVVAIPPSEYTLHRPHDEPRLRFSAVGLSQMCGAETVRVCAEVGYPAGDAKKALCEAIILLVKEWYDAGVSIGELAEAPASFHVKALIRQQRYCRPQVFG